MPRQSSLPPLPQRHILLSMCTGAHTRLTNIASRQPNQPSQDVCRLIGATTHAAGTATYVYAKSAPTSTRKHNVLRTSKSQRPSKGAETVPPTGGQRSFIHVARHDASVKQLGCVRVLRIYESAYHLISVHPDDH